MLLLTVEHAPTTHGEEIDRTNEHLQDFLDELSASGALIAAVELHDVSTTTTLRIRNQRAQITDGPVDHTTTNLVACITIAADHLDEAIEWAGRAPTATTGAVEIRLIRTEGHERVESRR